MNTMKAWVFERVGIDGLVMKDVAVPEVGPGQVRVKLYASALNHRDLYFVEGRSKADPGSILGSDGAGWIDAVGEGVTRVQIGDPVLIVPSLGWPHVSSAPPINFRILGVPDPGTFAEMIVLPEENVLPKPAYLSFEEAAALPLSALTAYRALITRAKLSSGETVLIPGIGGAVAQHALMIAHALGATVFVTSRDPEKGKRAKELGARDVFSTNDDFAQSVLQATGGVGVDVVVETVGGVTFPTALKALKKGGRLVTFAAGYGNTVELDIRSFFYGQYTLLGTTMGSTEEMQAMLTFYALNGLRPIIDHVYPSTSLREAITRLTEGQAFGKLLLKW